MEKYKIFAILTHYVGIFYYKPKMLSLIFLIENYRYLDFFDIIRK